MVANVPDCGRVLVVGGGPAGLAAAIAARQAGFDVTVFDRQQPPIDKACGEGLMPDGAECLRQLGIRVDRLPHRPFYGIRYLDGDTVAEGRFPGVHGMGVRRVALHQALVERAEQSGVELKWGVRVHAVGASNLRADSGFHRGKFIVAADGLRSPLRHQAGLAGRSVRLQRFGVRRHVRLAPWSKCVEVYWAQDCEAYVTPVSDDEVGIAILWSGRKAGFDDLIEAFPRLADRIRGAERLSTDRGIGPLYQRARAVYRDRLALIGDASGYVDAITGEGLSLAFHHAQALAAAMRAGDLGLYARAHRRIGALPDAMTRLLLWIERRPELRRRVVLALSREPEIFSRFLGVHCRARSWHSLGIEAAPRLLWQIVRA